MHRSEVTEDDLGGAGILAYYVSTFAIKKIARLSRIRLAQQTTVINVYDRIVDSCTPFPRVVLVLYFRILTRTLSSTLLNALYSRTCADLDRDSNTKDYLFETQARVQICLHCHARALRRSRIRAGQRP